MVPMTTAKEVQARLQRFYEDLPILPPERAPLYMHAIEWVGFATMYSDAARELSEVDPRFTLPRLQLSGHAAECALKACIVSSGEVPDKNHDLVAHADAALSLGYRLSEPQIVQIVHLNQNYFASLTSGTKFKARYPTQYFEGRREPAVSSMLIEMLVKELCRQATAVNDARNRDAFLAGSDEPTT